MADLRAAIVGYGLAGARFHAPLIESTDGLAVATVVTRGPDRVEQALREHPGVRVLARADELWARVDEHDVVVIAAPNALHAPLAREAVDAGLAVVVDKPLAPTAVAARALVDYARSNGVLLTVFHNRRWDSDHLTVLRLLAEDTLGEVRRYESRFERWRPEPAPGAWRETTPPAEGGGVLLDLGSHLVDQALVLFGPATGVYAEIGSTRGGAADDDAFLAINHEIGTHSHLWMSSVCAAPGPRLRVLGSRGGYVVEGVDGQEDALRSGLRPGGPDGWGIEPQSRWGRFVRGEKSETIASEAGAWPSFYERLELALREGGPPPIDPDDAVAALAVLDAARRSADAGALIEIT
jgi:predicted dehydrogenase